jgi:hypothetical protein
LRRATALGTATEERCRPSPACRRDNRGLVTIVRGSKSARFGACRICDIPAAGSSENRGIGRITPSEQPTLSPLLNDEKNFSIRRSRAGVDCFDSRGATLLPPRWRTGRARNRRWNNIWPRRSEGHRNSIARPVIPCRLLPERQMGDRAASRPCLAERRWSWLLYGVHARSWPPLPAEWRSGR